MLAINTKQNSFYSISVAIFLYATLIVDLYRKIGIGIAVDTVRNVFYIVSFGLILIDIIKSKHFIKMFVLFTIVSLFFLVSSLINHGYDAIYISTYVLFVSRLLPAFYIGRYTENWDNVCKYVGKFIWIALIYAVIAIITPYDGSSNAYATIATNLVFITFITFKDAVTNLNYLRLSISIICFATILFLGTRAVFFGTLLSIILILSIYVNSRRKITRGILWLIVIISVTLIYILQMQTRKGFG